MRLKRALPIPVILILSILVSCDRAKEPLWWPVFYDQNGKSFEPAEYRPIVEEKLKEAAKELPVIVEGEANWAVVKMDEHHFRVTLVDPGFLDPDDRDVKIVLQHGGWSRCTDILGKEDLPIEDGKISIRIPMGSVRIVDLIK